MTAFISARTRAERVLVGVGALSVAAAIIVWAIVPAAPPVKGLGPSGPRPEMLLAFFAGTVFVAGTIRSAAAAWRTRAWPVAHGVLTDVRAIEKPYVCVTSSYTVGGRTYSIMDVRHRLGAAYSVGELVVLRYDPAAPETASIQPLVSRATVATLVAGAVLLVASSVVMVAPSLS